MENRSGTFSSNVRYTSATLESFRSSATVLSRSNRATRTMSRWNIPEQNKCKSHSVQVSGIKISAHPGIRSYSLEDRWALLLL